jgi:hypothetical protein
VRRLLGRCEQNTGEPDISCVSSDEPVSQAIEHIENHSISSNKENSLRFYHLRLPFSWWYQYGVVPA